MIGLIAQRFAQMLFVMEGISVLAFLIFFATPGAAGSAPGATLPPCSRCAQASGSIVRCRCSTP